MPPFAPHTPSAPAPPPTPPLPPPLPPPPLASGEEDSLDLAVEALYRTGRKYDKEHALTVHACKTCIAVRTMRVAAGVGVEGHASKPMHGRKNHLFAYIA